MKRKDSKKSSSFLRKEPKRAQANDFSDDQYDPTDSSLFKMAMKGVQAFSNDRAELNKQRQHVKKTVYANTPSFPESSLSDPLDNPDNIQADTPLAFAEFGTHHRHFKRLQQGRQQLESHCDLHGYSISQARQKIDIFIQTSCKYGYRCVLIIHGKARHAECGPTLKIAVNHWLRHHDDVIAFCSAKPAEGGTGSVYVMLRQTATNN